MDPLPLTEDLVKLASENKEEICFLTEKLKRSDLNKKETKECFNRLVTATEAAVIFNKRRGGEASRLLVSSYLDRKRESQNEDIAKTLSPLEQKLAEKLDLVDVIKEE